MVKNNKKYFLLLHAVLLIYSAGAVCSKLAAGQEFLSFKFILFYGCVLLSLMIYALAWQQVIKALPLTTAFANKAVTLIWGLICGALIFHEQITIGKIAGAAITAAGVILFVTAKDEEEKGGDDE